MNEPTSGHDEWAAKRATPYEYSKYGEEEEEDGWNEIPRTYTVNIRYSPTASRQTWSGVSDANYSDYYSMMDDMHYVCYMTSDDRGT